MMWKIGFEAKIFIYLLVRALLIGNLEGRTEVVARTLVDPWSITRII